LLLIVHLSILLQVCKAASRRCPGWRRRRPASVSGAYLEGSQTNLSFSFSQGCLSHCWLSERVSCFSLFGCLFGCRCSVLRIEDVRGAEGVVQRLIRFSCSSRKLPEPGGGSQANLCFSQGCFIHCWLSERLHY
jgi:hypothetical protein